MKSSSWKECLENKTALKISSDKAKAKSLLETSDERIIFLESSKLDERNVRFIFEGYYSSAMETLHALTILNGYKVENHVCLGHYIKDVLKNEKIYRIFDDARFKRNSIIYYGKTIEYETGKESIEKLKKLIKEIKAIIKI